MSKKIIAVEDGTSCWVKNKCFLARKHNMPYYVDNTAKTFHINILLTYYVIHNKIDVYMVKRYPKYTTIHFMENGGIFSSKIN